MGRPKKKPRDCRTARVAVVLTPAGMSALRARAEKERRVPSALAAILIEDGLGVIPAPAPTSSEVA